MHTKGYEMNASTRFYSFTDRTGARRFAWLAHDPDAADWIDCTDMDDAAFEAHVRSVGAA